MTKMAALLSKEEKVIIVPITGKIKSQLFAIQTYSEKFLEEFLILNSGPGEIELNPNWTWRFVLETELFIIDKEMYPIPMYKEQQH